MQLNAYLVSNSTDVYSYIPSRVPNPNHHHSFPFQTLSAAVFPAVEVSAFKALNT